MTNAVTTLSMTQGAVVVGVDGSACSDIALAWAVGYAADRRRPLLVVGAAGIHHVGSELFGSSGAAEAMLATSREVTAAALRTALALEPALETHVLIPLHDAREALLECSERASMVVVGTRGLGPVGRLLLGSVSQAVSAHAACPVAVVRSSQGRHARDGAAQRGPVVVGTDSADGSAGTLDMAFDLASTEARELEVVHSRFVLDGFVGAESPDQSDLHREEEARLLAESLAGYAEKYPDVTIHRQLPDEGAATALVELSRTASVVVVGADERTGGHRRASSVSRDVLEHAHSTVVVVRS